MLLRASLAPCLVVLAVGCGGGSDAAPESTADTAAAATDWTCFNDPWVESSKARFYGELRPLGDDELRRVRELEGLWVWSSADIAGLGPTQYKFALTETSPAPWIPSQPGKPFFVEYRMNKATGRYERSGSQPAAGFLCDYERRSGRFDARYNRWDRDRDQRVNGHPLDLPPAVSPPTVGHIGPQGSGQAVAQRNGFFFTKADRDPSGDWYMLDALQYGRLVACYQSRACGRW